METSAGDKDEVGEDKQLERSLSENWDAPIIITTSVQALESLHSNRPSDARKLHSLAQSVILFDEVQSLPQNLLLPTLKTLSRLASPQFGSSVVFATATQPAFSEFHEMVQQNETNIGWAPTEIVPDSLNLFARASRVQVDWSHALQPLTHEAVAATISDKKQALCIVNMRRDAQKLSSLLRELCRDDEASLFHLSTFMCSAHRLNVLEEVRDRLSHGRECRLVSTQCIEAGTDVDFSFGMRALAPFSSIAQAAGRVNRNGLRELENLQVFDLVSEGQKYPDKAYEQGADVTKIMLAEYGEERLHLDDPQLFYDYYHKLYMLSQPDKANEPLKEAILRQDYVEVSNLYKLIDDDCVNVLVPYRLNESLDAFDALSDEALDQGLSPQWIRKAQPLTISLYRSYLKSELGTRLQPIPLAKRKGGGNSDQWFIELEKNNYDELTGFILEKGISAIFG